MSKKVKRDPGWYWCKITWDGDWWASYWSLQGYWIEAGTQFDLQDNRYDFIGPKIETPDIIVKCPYENEE